MTAGFLHGHECHAVVEPTVLNIQSQPKTSTKYAQFEYNLHQELGEKEWCTLRECRTQMASKRK